MTTIDLSQFFQTFFDEATDHLADMERLLLQIDVTAPVADDLDSVFRAAHSIKGGAGIFGFTKLAELTHVLESHLDLIRSGKARMTDAISDELLHAVDYLRDLLQCCRDGSEVDEKYFATMRERFERLGAAEGRAALATVAVSEIADDGSYGLFEPAVATEIEEGFGLFEPVANGPASDDDNEGFGFFEPLVEPESVEALPSVQAAPVVALPVAATPTREVAVKANTDAASIRVSVERVDQLINLVGELVITQAMLAETGQQMEGALAERLLHSLGTLERNTRDLQEAVLSIRMLPISFVFNRFPRVVRDLSQKLNKQVDLVLYGEGTELDRGFIEKLVDPLTHLVRNSIDHGIESPDQRLAAGKSARGTVNLRASQQGGNIVVEVIDDGAGLNRERILAKARESGLPVHDAMTDAEVWLLIFAPGFSTAAEVTDVSGRGVGMDVVKRNIADLGGRVEVASTAGKGSTFTIRLPLTLAILDGMSIAVGKEVFIVPITFILESLQPRKEDIKRVAGQGEVIQVRGDYLPLIHLSKLLGIPANDDQASKILLLVQSGGDKAALQVDALLGQHQVVIKSLEVNYRRVPGVSGATVMGDGRVALILDVADLVRQHAMAAAA
jgi:two-component system chemotaxis sensor kinase CheA